jgi:uncharacterized protein YqgC (DUF456 family)
MIAWLCYLLLIAASFAGLLLLALALPGLWLMTAACGIYALVTHERYLGGRSLLLLFSVTLVADIVDMAWSKLAMRRAGGSGRAVVGGIIGGFLGGILASMVLLIPILSTIIGICLGVFLGAAIGEFTGTRSPGQALGVGMAAAKGKLTTYAAKLVVGGVMILIIIVMAWP